MRKLFVVFCLFLISPFIYAESTSCNEHQCIAVIDAGSTGSRAHLFSYDLDETSTPINITELWSKNIKPGLATLEAKQTNIDEYMNRLLSESPVQNIPVYFYATAGMRLLSLAKQKIYYQQINNWFNINSNWQLINAKTITGDDEALYDWLSVNYHLGVLQSVSQESIGVIDIGGASTQIAFPLNQSNELSLNKNSVIELTLYGQQIKLFAHSFIGLGQNETSHQLLDSISCFADNYPLTDGEKGQGDASECVKEISLLINGVHKTNRIVRPGLANNPISTWYALGGIAYLADSKPFHFQNNQLTTQDFLQQADNFVCHQQWEQLNDQFPDNEYLDDYCLFPAFYYSLLVDGYGFSPNQPVHYLPSTQNLDWTLGVVLHH